MVVHLLFPNSRMGQPQADLSQPGLVHQAVSLFTQGLLRACALHRNLANLQEQRCGKWGYLARMAKINLPLGARDHRVNAAKINQPLCGFFPGDLQQQVVGLIFAQCVIHDVR